eukprot:PLAT11918.1.p1 GENE.PLAT11918.1~~PLAT11918.1.p1  ORF type:complete len:485 (-),score=183.26 PLAT11918.1:97-1551(-)
MSFSSVFQLKGQLAACLGGSVDEATARADGRRVAVKRIRRVRSSAAARASRASVLASSTQRELATMDCIRKQPHRHLLTHEGLFREPRWLFIVLPLCAGGDLYSSIEVGGPIPERRARAYFASCLAALTHLHHLGWAHMDVSLENILLRNREEAEAADGSAHARYKAALTPGAPASPPRYPTAASGCVDVDSSFLLPAGGGSGCGGGSGSDSGAEGEDDGDAALRSDDDGDDDAAGGSGLRKRDDDGSSKRDRLPHCCYARRPCPPSPSPSLSSEDSSSSVEEEEEVEEAAEGGEEAADAAGGGMLSALSSLSISMHSMRLQDDEDNVTAVQSRLAAVVDSEGAPWRAMLADFGLARQLCADGKVCTPDALTSGFGTVLGKRGYLPPEMWQPGAMVDGSAVDIFSLGVVLFIMLTGVPPFAIADAKADSRFRIIDKGLLPQLLRSWDITWLSDSAVQLLTAMLSSNPADRPTASEIVEHAWMSV